MRTYQLFHFFALADDLRKFSAADDRKQRKVCLYHQTDSVAQIIYFLLNGALGYAQKVHIAGFCHKHIVKQHIKIAAKNVLLFKAHSVCPAQTNAFAV